MAKRTVTKIEPDQSAFGARAAASSNAGAMIDIKSDAFPAAGWDELPAHHEIAARAYFLWLRDGGDAESNWLRAEHELRAKRREDATGGL